MRPIAIILTLALLAAYAPAGAQGSWVVLVSPGDGETVSGQRAEVCVSYSTGSADKVTHVELVLDGALYGVKHLSTPAERGMASFLVDTTRFGNGAHTIVAKVFSGSRLFGSASGSCRIGNRPVDVLPPEVKFVGIKSGETLSGTALVELSAKDSSGLDPLVSVFIDKSLKLIKNVPPYTYVWDTTVYDNGRHVLDACALDVAGNKAETPELEVIVRNAARGTDPPVRRSSQAAAPERKSEPGMVASAKPPAEPRRDVKNPEVTTSVPVERRQPAVAARSLDRPAVVAAAPGKPPSLEVGGRKLEVGHSSSPTSNLQPLTSRPVAERITSSVSEPRVSDVPQRDPAPAPQVGQPNLTPPAAAVRPSASPQVVDAVPSDALAPTVPAIPSAAPPVATGVSARGQIAPSNVVAVQARATSGQKLVRPSVPKLEPVRIALAPERLPVSARPAPEHRKVITLKVRKSSGVIVTELRRAVEASGGAVISWNQETRTVLAAAGGKRIKIDINNSTAVVDGRTVTLSKAPYINGKGRTMVDIRFLQGILGNRIEVQEDTGEWVLVSAS